MGKRMLMLGVCLATAAGMAHGELQNVLVGGVLRIRGNVYNSEDDVLMFGGAQPLTDTSFVEQRTRLNVRADFTDNVSAFLELDSYDIWGEDFRSNYITGIDGRAFSGNDVEFYQAYIDVKEMWDTPLHLRIGRQELAFGSQFLVGVNDTSAFFTGLSFDAIRVGYETDMVAVDVFAAKLAETFGDFGDDDVDLYGVYGSYLGLEDVTIDAYWLYLRDDGGNKFGGFDRDVHTVGIRGAVDSWNNFDAEAEVAYQFGEVDDVPGAFFGLFNSDVEYNAFAVNGEIGYTFDVAWQPRLFVGGAWFDGGDDECDYWWQSNDRDLPFNRLFSNWEYSEFIDNTDLSNAIIYRAGVSAQPTEALGLRLAAAYYQADAQRTNCGPFGDCDKADDNLGWEVGLYADYDYSDDLVFRAGYAHFFSGDGVDEGNFVRGNGLLPLLASDDDDYDYFFLESEVSF
ncbi:alginate export family protein [Roseovarius pacificus]|uniref:alginate export family protein n=1 Tax=Roseovarius pacificus TaxID=337701 RepID=UPI002A18ADD5|nr:alginate export family protein [Roseovarius pacificus]